ncbi:MAG: bifunctional folylpolyglutamate synthase/dihydrofolate synthase [Mariprofundaceae bacterium]|nr:bifunctional folylpolyglutamate synthase/dihydrofolate synthase [Mariprofundaceae bacterium]
MKPKNIDDWLNQLGQPSADRDYKPGHERMLALLKPLHCKRPSLRIRIAGTNGKGSTAFMLAAGLQAAGLKVGLYTSPHILHFNERIRINGQAITDADLWQHLEMIMPTALEAGASYFEVATALALHHFSQNNVDVEILEAGVGARLDATTAVDADMALLTPIGLDHETWLGDNIASVAKEKVYALHGCRWGISAPQTSEVRDILLPHHENLQFTEVFDLPCLMAGKHQQTNASLAYKALKTLCNDGIIQADKDTLKHAVTQAIAPGRLQYIAYHKAHIWLDAAHNRHAIEALLPSLPALADPFDAILVYTREDRSLQNEFNLLRPFAKKIISDMPDKGMHICIASVEEALQYALGINPATKILLLGSFISVAAGLQYLKET